MTAVRKRWLRFWQYVRPIAAWGISLLVVVALVALAVNYILSNYVSAVDPDDPTPYEVVIPNNSSASAIAHILYTACGEDEEGLIVSTASFKIYVDFVGKANSLKAGTYRLSKNMTIGEIVNVIVKGNPARRTTRFTVPEGYTVDDVARLLYSEGLIEDAERFKSLCRDGKSFAKYPFLAELKNTSERTYALEGYLFPDTYEVYVDADGEEIIDKMLTRYYAVYTEDYIARADELNLTRDQVMTLASLIEREARESDDFSKVSAVFHNRIAQGMKLESCASLSYATGENRWAFSAEELALVSPYNTYLNAGLPIGPICSPGESAIQAALYPNEEYLDEGYLYFCNGDPKASTALIFSKTYEEHQQNVEQYREFWE